MGTVASRKMIEACEIIVGDSRNILAKLPAETFHCAITSPPYWGLRDYGIVGQIGAEMEMEEYISDLVMVFQGVKRVLRDLVQTQLPTREREGSAYTFTRTRFPSDKE